MEHTSLSILNVDELISKIEEILNNKIQILISHSPNKQASSYITRFEAAKLLKISLPTLTTWSKMGWITSYKIGRRVFFKPNEIDEAFKSLGENKHKKFSVPIISKSDK